MIKVTWLCQKFVMQAGKMHRRRRKTKRDQNTAAKHKRRGTYDQRGVCSDFNTKDTLKQMMYHNTPKEETIMASRSSNRAAVPEAKSALDRFKYEVASEIGVPLKDGYNGDLTSRQNGSVGGYIAPDKL